MCEEAEAQRSSVVSPMEPHLSDSEDHEAQVFRLQLLKLYISGVRKQRFKTLPRITVPLLSSTTGIKTHITIIYL